MWKWTKRRKVWDPGNQSPIQWSSKWVSVEAMCASQWQSYLPILELAILGAGVKSSRIKCGPSKIWWALAFWNITVGHLSELLEHLETIKDICIENQANKKWRNFRGKKKVWVKNKHNVQTNITDLTKNSDVNIMRRWRKREWWWLWWCKVIWLFNCNIWNK